ncbi:MAG TPA: hypothetical protein VFD59_20545 [Nocardioidaceae bacterium]|nr:hypothetical protein [Nocardioidaceae bacterium]
MSGLLKQLEAAFDQVIIDAPPLLPVTDAAVLSKIADGVIVVVCSRQTAKHELERSLVTLQSVDARLLGLVINKLPRKGPGAMYYGYGYAPDTSPRSAPKQFPKDSRELAAPRRAKR